ncbi:hypothetical protein U2F10_05445 [Leptothoe sp. EHU-05/26/07-4]
MSCWVAVSSTFQMVSSMVRASPALQRYLQMCGSRSNGYYIPGQQISGLITPLLMQYGDG